MAADVAEHPVTGPSPSFDRTVDRRLVHRSAVSEVFLTDVRALGGGRVLLGAQLPTCHGYFDDHAHEGSAVDALLVLEVCRQASLASAHELGVPLDTILISGGFGLEIVDPGAWRAARDTGRMQLETAFTWTRMRRGRPRAGVCEQRILLDGALAATHTSSGTLLTRSDMATLRAAQRGTPPRWTADLVDDPVADAVPPAAVGRRDPHNVVLAGLRRDGGRLAARVAPRWSNRALFDHSYDHLTMQVLTEAARQLALLRVGGSDAGPDHGADDGDRLRGWELTGLSGTFSRFAELDEVVTARADAPGASGLVAVAVEQAGETVADLELTFAHGGRT